MMYRVQTISAIEELIAPSFTLPSTRDGTPVSLYAFRQRKPVGLLFVPQTMDVPVALANMSQMVDEFHEANLALLLITREPIPDVPTEPAVLVDCDGNVFHRYECAQNNALCLFGLDRYGAVVYRSTCEPAGLESALRELLDAIEFSEIQCPE